MTESRRDRDLDVLVVEDNPGDVHLIREAFEGSEVESGLTVVTDGEEALEYVNRRTDEDSIPDLVVLDLNVPKVTGRLILEAIRDDPKLRSIPVLVLSGSAAPDDVRRTYELGADGYFVKPVDPDEFIALVRSVERSVAERGRVPRGEHADLDGTG